MARSKTIRVTPNLEKCLKILSEAASSLPQGDLKERSQAAINYLSQTFEGKPQPNRGRSCKTPPYLIIPD